MNYKTYYPDEKTLSKMTSMASFDAIVVHHTASNPHATVEDIRRWHVVERESEGFLWVGYHFVIYQSGEIIQTRPINKRGGHCDTGGYNERSIGVCLVGNFENMNPPTDQWKSFVELSLKLAQISPGIVLLPHGKIDKTICPGVHIVQAMRGINLNNSEVQNEPVRKELSAYSLEELTNELHKRIQLKHYD